MPCDYHYGSAEPSHTATYLWPTIIEVIQENTDLDERILDLGCGNGAFAAHLSQLGYVVIGVDPSRDGIEHGRRKHPTLELHQGSSDEDLAARFGRFDLVVSLEVIEHAYSPRDFVRTIHSVLRPGGTVVLSTPYHGYLKNLALAVTGKLDAHFTALWDHGHVKFWSMKTLRHLLAETGFEQVRFHRVGRIPPLAKSMVAIAHRP